MKCLLRHAFNKNDPKFDDLWTGQNLLQHLTTQIQHNILLFRRALRLTGELFSHLDVGVRVEIRLLRFIMLFILMRDGLLT